MNTSVVAASAWFTWSLIDRAFIARGRREDDSEYEDHAVVFNGVIQDAVVTDADTVECVAHAVETRPPRMAPLTPGHRWRRLSQSLLK